MKHRQNGGGPKNPFEPEGNIYQHSGQSIERTEHRLAAQLGSYFGSHDLDVANREWPQRIAVLEGANDLRGDSGHRRRTIEVGEHAVLLLVAVIQDGLSQLRVLVPGIYGKQEGIALRQEGSQGGRSRGVEVRLDRIIESVDRVQGVEHLGLAGVSRFVTRALLLHENEHFVRVRAGDIADALNFAIPQTLRSQAAAELVDIGWLGKADVHVGAAFEVDAVPEPAFDQYGSPARKQENAAKGIEILGFAHPIDAGLFEELDHASFCFPSLDSKGSGFVPGRGDAAKRLRQSQGSNLQDARFESSEACIPRVLVHASARLERLNAQYPLAVHLPQVILEDRLGNVDRGEHVGDQTDGQGHGETANRAGTEQKQEESGDHRRDVRVDNGQESFREAGIDRGSRRLAVAQFFANTLENQDVRVHAHTNGQNHAGNARQCQNRAERSQSRQ